MKKLVLILAAACVIATGCTGTNTNTGESAGAATGMLKAGGLCDMCKTRIEQAAKEVDGVTKAEWDRDTKMLAIEFDSAKTGLEAISKAVAKAGHDTDKDEADDDVYDELPGCCKYREQSEHMEHT